MSESLPIGTLVKFKSNYGTKIGKIMTLRGKTPKIRHLESYAVFFKDGVYNTEHNCDSLFTENKGLYLTNIKDNHSEGDYYVFEVLCDSCELRGCNTCNYFNDYAK